MAAPKTIIVSNRLPVKISIKNNEWNYQSSEGGLATGLGSIYKEQGGIWIGWPGAIIETEAMQKAVCADLRQKALEPVFLSQEEITAFYEGFSNQALWPLFHYFPTYANYDEHHWQTYCQVNQKYADAVLNIVSSQDVVWIHDYQLMLVPQMIRTKMPDVSIGFFQHIPFPSYEVFRLIPWRAELLSGLLGADLIGFHTHDDVRHFISAILRILDVQSNMNEISFGSRVLRTDAFPMGIDYQKYRNTVFDYKTKKFRNKIQQRIEGKKLMISIDRLDYSKGILHRLTSFELFLKKYPRFRESVIFFQLVVPSRDNVKEYKKLRQEINKMVSNINAQYGTISWQPICYFYRSWPLEMLSALYASADIALVTPLRDGMNLVCKEYVASKTTNSGVLILSEMAGASKELTDALIINPTNVSSVAAAIQQALLMDKEEKEARMNAMQHTIERFNIHFWVKNFLTTLRETKDKQELLKTHHISEGTRTAFLEKYAGAQKRLIFLDYDGTLVPFNNDPMKAIPSEQVRILLQKLCSDPKNRIVIISGRKKENLAQWLGYLDLDIIAEHGAWTRKNGDTWQTPVDLNGDWKKDILPILQQYEMRTPGSFVEIKDYSVAWHYRKAETSLGELRAKEIAGNLKYMVADLGLQILEGHKVIEIKNSNINKGKAVKEWIRNYPSGFIIALGDDMTDEDTFKAMPAKAITIKVGGGMSAARYYLDSPEAVTVLLETFLQCTVPLK